MKKNPINFSKLVLCTALVFGVYSCQTEELSEDDDALLTAKVSPSKDFTIADCDEIYSIADLYAGQDILVGNVSVTGSNGSYEVTYNITNSGYCLTETHLSVVTDPNNFPMTKSGNTIPGEFEYSESHDCITSYTYTVNLVDFQESNKVYIAAHAVVNCVAESSHEDTIANLPTTISACVKAKPGENSYFDLTINPENSLSGITAAWCLDYQTHLDFPQCFDADVYTIFDDLSEVSLDYEGTLGAINWILNQDFISSGYTYGEIQFAIWKFIENAEIDGPYLGPYDPNKGREIYNAALEHLDFVPECGDLLGVILIPHIVTIQPTIILVPFECNEVGDCEETAWADGCDFPGNNWATFFQYGEE